MDFENHRQLRRPSSLTIYFVTNECLIWTNEQNLKRGSDVLFFVQFVKKIYEKILPFSNKFMQIA